MITIVTWGRGKRQTDPEVDWIVSCLRLDNPPSALWTLDGRDIELRQYIASQISFKPKLSSWFSGLENQLVGEASKGKDITIGFYCHGGRHRSVSVAELMKKIFRKRGFEVKIQHLELQ